jgi:hypothetical protein
LSESKLRPNEPTRAQTRPRTRPSGEWSNDDYDVLADGVLYALKRAKYLVSNITDATPKVIAVAKVRTNIAIHICSSIAWQAGARPVSQPPAPGTEPRPMICAACAYYWRQARHFFAIGKTGHSLRIKTSAAS